VRDVFLESLREQAAPVRGLRVLLWGFSGAGFPGGDGVAEAAEVLPLVGIETVRSNENDHDRHEKLSRKYDVAIVCNTRVGAVLKYDPRVWSCAETACYWFWDLRPGHVAAPLRGRVGRVFLSYDGEWTDPSGNVYSPAQWAAALGCPVGYCPQGAPLRTPDPQPNGHRALFVGDLGNKTYHRGRKEIVDAIGATVINASARDKRLAIERRMPELYPGARYCLSMSPRAPGYTSVRTYSILACGGLMLLHRFPGAEQLMTDGEHAVFFDSADELVERLAELDGNEVERRRIAEAGRRLHATRHTVAHRVIDICRQTVGA
jgi:hypothetical protein